MPVNGPITETTSLEMHVELCAERYKRLEEKMPDYHVLFIGDNRKRGGVKFECFNTSDLRTVDFDYLKWYIKNNFLTQR